MSSSNVTSSVPSANDNSNLFVIQLQVISQYLSIVLCFIIFIAGNIGNFLNILIFLRLGNYRKNACSLYMLAGSVTDSIFAVIGLVTRILTDGFRIDFTIQNQVWCKLRPYILITSSLCAFTFIWLQSADAYFATSRSPIWRQKSNVRMARYFVIATVIFWVCHNVPYLFFENIIVGSNGALPRCVIANTVYSQYHTYFLNLCVTLIISLMIITVFGFLTYRNLRTLNIRNQNSLSSLTKQMSRMALAQIVIVFLCQGAYTITNSYFLATAYHVKSDNLRAQEKVVTTVFSIHIYIIHTSAFYCYYLASKRFRKQTATVLRLITGRANNQVMPFPEARNIANKQHQIITSTPL